MHGLSNTAFARATETHCPDGQVDDQMVRDVLADAARMLWPAKTPENLAACIGCTVRAAARYLAGDREWSGDALAAVVSEILKRHGMRNFKIAKKT